MNIAMNDYETKHFQCTCGCGGLAVSFFNGDRDVCFSMFDIRAKTNLLWRLKHAWHCIRYGHPHLDDVILEKEEAWELCNYIQQRKADLSRQG